MEYKIGKRERTSFLDVRGHAVDGYRIHYTVADGHNDYIEIEKAQYTFENVKVAIETEIMVHAMFSEG